MPSITRTLVTVGVRVGLSCAIAASIALTGTSAHADSPPMPPCPPGWNQLGTSACTEPFKCPQGWQLAAGPVCEPHVCKDDRECNWKGIVPCADAKVCVDGKGKAIRLCERSGECPSGLTCKPSKLCAQNGVSGGDPKFTNWQATNAPATASPTGTPTPSPSASASASASPSGTPPPGTLPPPTKKSGCATSPIAGAPGGPAGPILLALGLAAALGVRRRR